MTLGHPRKHLRTADSTNLRARALAQAGAPHGTLVTAREQSAGRGRQGRVWVAPAGQALLMSVIVRHPPRLLSLIAGLSVAEVVGSEAKVKWPNDVLLSARKVAGILVEGRPQEDWAVVGVGLNVALRLADLPTELKNRAGTLGLPVSAVEVKLTALLEALSRGLRASEADTLADFRARDALLGRPVRWGQGSGTAAGLDGAGHLLVDTPADGQLTLQAGEVHLL